MSIKVLQLSSFDKDCKDTLNKVSSVMQGGMTVEDSITKHGIDLAEYSEQLK